jgi:hypothetical protein
MGVEFGIVGGAGVSLIMNRYNTIGQYRETADVDLIVKPNHARNITAERISRQPLVDYPNLFEGINQYGVIIPALKFDKDGQKILVKVEIFDIDAWPQRPQYNLANPQNSRVKFSIGQEKVPVMNPAWILREKLSSQMGREGSVKEKTDIDDIVSLAAMLDAKELKIKGSETVDALKRLLVKRPDLRPLLAEVIDCKEVFSLLESFSSSHYEIAISMIQLHHLTYTARMIRMT